MRIVAPPPAIERLPADPKVTAGEGRIAAVTEIMTHPDQSKLPDPAQLAPKTRHLSRSGYLPSSYLHADTLPSVTNHSEREQCHAGSGQFSIIPASSDGRWTVLRNA